MSYYTDDAVKAKLSSLNDTHDSVVNVAQWLLFHRRHSARTAELWLSKVKDTSPVKRLSLIYLVNEVVQQSRARRKEDFVNAFTPIIVEAVAIAYKSSTLDIQNKIKRVVEVWRARAIFDLKAQELLEAKLDEIDRSRASSRKGVLGGSLFADATPTAPPELQPLLAAHQTLSRTDAKASTATGRFETDDAKAHDSRVEPKSLPARAAQLAALLTTLGEAETSVAEGVRARQLVVEQLERLLQDNRGALRRDEETMAGLRVKRAGLEREWAAVEDSIVRGLEAAPPATGVDVVDVEALRPAMEPLTPPPVESLTPVGSPKRARAPEPPASTMPPPPAASAPDLGSGASLLEIARDMDLRRSAGAGAGASAEPAAKRRRVDAHADEFDGLQGDALGSIDPDVAAMLARD